MSTTDRFRPSVTVAAVIANAGRYLLVEEETPEGLMLNNPAGHLEQGESPIEAVVREALEVSRLTDGAFDVRVGAAMSAFADILTVKRNTRRGTYASLATNAPREHCA